MNTSAVQFDNSNQLKRILYRFSSYIRILQRFISNGVPILEIIKTRFPYYFSDNPKPCSLSVELGNVCNLKCVYCNVPHYSDQREFMSKSIFEKLIENLKKENINRIDIGGGEPTLHPNFIEFMSEVRKYTKFLSIITNAQWNQPRIVNTLINTPFDLIEVSMDAGGKEVYESSRVGASYELFEENLQNLKELKEKKHSKALIGMRLMLRPSTKNLIDKEKIKCNKYCDCIMPQFILKIPETNYDEDIFIPIQRQNNSVPKCTLPFKDCMLKLNGDIPYCNVTGSTITRKRLIAGNILNDSIHIIWNTQVKKIRTAHRKRIFSSSETEYCKGCSSY